MELKDSTYSGNAPVPPSTETQQQQEQEEEESALVDVGVTTGESQTLTSAPPQGQTPLSRSTSVSSTGTTESCDWELADAGDTDEQVGQPWGN